MSLAQVQNTLEIPVASNIPKPGGWALFSPGEQYSEHGHVAVILRVGTSTLDIVEANYKKCGISVRTISKWDKELRGYYVK